VVAGFTAAFPTARLASVDIELAAPAKTVPPPSSASPTANIRRKS